MDSRRGDFEVPLHIGLGRRSAVELRVIMNEREVLALVPGNCKTGAKSQSKKETETLFHRRFRSNG